MKNRQVSGGLAASAWIAYVIIVFEILYMVSPFALYYYSAYAPPLRFLQGSPATAFLTMHILPHFSYQSSAIISALQRIAWPMIALGLTLFLVGFSQIYWAKFSGTGPVKGGLYRIVRHPQYVALAVVGLGATLFWPRFIAFLMYGTMLFLYYFLAVAEERRCLRLYGDSYARYISQTGRFLPHWIEAKLPDAPLKLPEGGWRRTTAIGGLYAAFMLLLVFFGFQARDYAVSKVAAVYSENSAAVAVASLESESLAAIVRLTMADSSVGAALADRKGRKLLYVVPHNWKIPELGLEPDVREGNYLANAGSHGNAPPEDDDTLLVLITEPILSTPTASGIDILKESVGFQPICKVLLDPDKGEVVGVSMNVDAGRWSGVPVPVF